MFSYDYSDDSIIEDIIKLSEDRGLRNLAHVDRQPIIEKYAKSFSEYYEMKLLAAR